MTSLESVPLASVEAIQRCNSNEVVSQNHHSTNSSTFPDFYGMISFEGLMRQSVGFYTRVHADEYKTENGFDRKKLDLVYDLLTEEWEMPTPHLIVSVIGGAMNFDVKTDALSVFKDLVRLIAETPGAWIMTGGIHGGVSKHVGDALMDKRMATVLGFPKFEAIADKEKLMIPRESGEKEITEYHVKSWLETDVAYLDPNHENLLIYDDGTGDTADIEFRTTFERYVVEKMNIPCILIVFNGGTRTLKCIP